jgi:hypothetical protein
MRLQVPTARGNPHALGELRDSIAKIDGVEGVQVNPRTGSVVVQYTPTEKIDFHQQITEHGETTGGFLIAPPELSEVDELARKIEREAEFLSQHSETARMIVDAFKGLDISVKKATNNAVDLKVLLPLGLAVYSAVEIGLEASTPLWVTLGIFSFNSFVSLHTAPTGVNRKEEIVVTDTSTTDASKNVDPPPVRVTRRRSSA